MAPSLDLVFGTTERDCDREPKRGSALCW